jgi:cell division septal protein FtsQ
MFGRQKFRSRELENLRRQRSKRLFLFSGFAFAALVVIASLVPRLDAFTIKNIGVTGNSIESSEELSAYISR